MSPAWTIVEHEGREGLLRLRHDWDRLVAAMPDAGIQHTHSAHLGYSDHLGCEFGPMLCLALSDGSTIRAICPVELQRRPILGRPILVWGLPQGLGDLPRDVICPRDADAERALFPLVAAHLRRTRRGNGWLMLERVLEDAVAMRCLKSFDRGHYHSDFDASSDVIDTDRPFDEIAGALSRNFRANLRKARNKLIALPGVRYVNATDPPSVRAELDAFLHVEESGWKGGAGTASAVSFKPKSLAYFRGLAESVRATDRTEVNSLYSEDRCIASQLCVRVGREYGIIKIGFDEEFARVAPGQLLLEHTLARCCADPAITRVNLVSDAAWHRDWHPIVLKAYNVYIATGGFTARARAALVKARFRYGPALKSWLLRSRFGSRLVRRVRNG